MASFNSSAWLYGFAQTWRSARGTLYLSLLSLACFACGTKGDAPELTSGGAPGTAATGGESHSAQASGGNDGADSASGMSSAGMASGGMASGGMASAGSSVGGGSPGIPPRVERVTKPEDTGFKKPDSSEAAVRTFLAQQSGLPAAPRAPAAAPQFTQNQVKDLNVCSSVTLTSDHASSTFNGTGQYAVKGQTLVWTASAGCGAAISVQY